jgi:glycosyltransferase involved in cell wall biosynthesis
MKKILLIENYGSDFYKARIPFAKFLLKKGFDVYAFIPYDDYTEKVNEAGIRTISYKFDRKNKGFLQLFTLIFLFRKVINSNNFEIIHSFRFQPNLVNVLANFFNGKLIILHVTGLGIAFSNNNLKYIIFRILSQIVFLLKFIRANKIVFQNNYDASDIWISRFFKRKIKLIYGSGVDIGKFDSSIYNKSQIRLKLNIHQSDLVFICVTRLIWEKGIKELLSAFKLMAKSQINLKLIIVGFVDNDNPRKLNQEFIDSFKNSDSIYFLGKRDDIPDLIEAADVFIYPSYYREGIPRSLLEALSMSKPIITTNTPGCNMTVIDNLNGLLIEPRSSSQIVKAVTFFANNVNLIEGMGINSRLIARNKFSNEIIFEEILKLYLK